MKRISKYAKIKITETEADDYNFPKGRVVCLAVGGAQLSSEEFAGFIEKTALESSRIIFVIGGADGLSEAVLKKADFLLSFSKATFPHRIARLILVEQIYRAFKILRREPYHK